MALIVLVEDDRQLRQAISRSLEALGHRVIDADQGLAGLKEIVRRHPDLVVLDLGLPDIDGHQVIRRVQQMQGLRDLPIIVYTAADLTSRERARLRRKTRHLIEKSGDSEQRLVEGVRQFLSRLAPAPLASAPSPLFNGDTAAPSQNGEGAAHGELAGRRVLVVDDDIRNVFALTALLERYGVHVTTAESGREALRALDEHPDIEAVLMDVMMPEMDGMETISQIRAQERYRRLPIIAVTAKAMAGDLERCLEGGASDYAAKPVDPTRLLAMLRSWLKT
jgi:CheY-like chemotaxis protein